MSRSGFISDTRGNVAIMAGVLALPAMLAVGSALDLTNMNRVEADVQAALDAATMELAVNVASGRSDAELQALGDSYFKAHLDASVFADGQMPSLVYGGLVTGSHGKQHLSTSASYQYALVFSQVAAAEESGVATWNFTVKSQISATTGDSACLYALSRTASRAVDASGNTAISMDGCVIASNSSAADAIYVGGSAALAADCLQSSGGIDATGGLVTDCEENRVNAWPLPDPFAELPEPVPPVLYPNPNNSDTVVQPGRYRNLSLTGEKRLEPGVYYIEGSLSIKGTITGTGVTFFMKDGGVTVNGNASLSLSAPTIGDYAGMLFMSAPENTSSHGFNGNGSTELDGYLYFPAGDVTYTGNNGTTSTCLRIVADIIEMTGSSTLESDCTAELGGREARVAGPLHYTR